MSESYASIDWLRMSADAGDLMTIAVEHGLVTSAGKAEETTPLPHYNYGLKLEYGRIDISAHEATGALLTLTGQDLIEWGRVGGSAVSLLEWLYPGGKRRTPELRVRVTRLDLAVDVTDPIARPDDIYEARGEARTRVQKWSRVESDRMTGLWPGVTVYVGSRQSARMLRIYDKAAEMELDCPWVRLELELKKPVAEIVARMCARASVGDVARSVMRDVLAVDVDWYNDMLNASSVPVQVPAVGGRQTATRDWIVGTCLPAIWAYMRDGDREIINKVSAMVLEVDHDYQKYREKLET